MWLMLQQKKPDDYVIASNKQYSIKEFINKVCKYLKMKIIWKGTGLNEKVYWNNKIIIEIDKKYFRPTEVNSLKGNYKKAKKILNWQPKISIDSIIEEMVIYELSKKDW